MNCDHSNSADDEIWPLIFFLLIAAPIVAPAYGVYHWLRYGEWSAVTIQDALNYLGREIPLTENWEGINRVIEGYLSSNIGWTILAFSSSVIWILILWDERKSNLPH